MPHVDHWTALDGIDESAPFGTVLFDGKPFPVRGGLGYANLATLGQKTVIGDPTQADDPIFSLWVMTDWSGGGQVVRLRPGSDQGRYRRGNLWARDPNHLTLGREVEVYALGGAGNHYPLGDLGGTFYAIDGDRDVHEFDPVTRTFAAVSGATLGQLPTNPGIEFGLTGAGSACVLWIPHGADGYSTFNGTADTLSTAIEATDFAEWDDQLWAIGPDGVLSSLNAGGGWTAQAQMDRRHTPYRLLVALDQADFPTLHVVTNRGVLAYSHAIRKFYPSHWRNIHPHGGIAADIGDGNVIHYAAGMGVRDYLPGGEVSPGGLDRDHGTPAEHRGRIVALAKSQDELWALVEGQQSIIGSTDPEAVQAQQAGGADVPSFGAIGASYATTYFRTLSGWFEAWDSGDASGAPTTLLWSTAGGELRVWWGYGSTGVYAINLPTDQHQPRTGLTVGADRFRPTGFLETGRNDMAMVGFEKIASHLQVNISKDPVGATETEWIEVQYRIDGAPAWQTLGSRLTAPGKRVLAFGLEDPNDPDSFSYGQAFEDIEFRLNFARDAEDATKSPLVEAVALHYLKNMHPSDSWVISIPLHFRDNEVWDFDPDLGVARNMATLRQDLEDVLAKPGMVKMQVGPRHWRVRLSQLQGADATGDDERGDRLVSVVGVSVDADEGG